MAARRDQDGEPEPDPKASRSQKRAELLTAATGTGKSPRVALEQQVLSQVPPRAVRYRLVLGVEQQFQNAVIAPEDSAWNLMPFEAPNDLRLLPGHTYRIVWIDRHGKPVRPLEWAPTPSLHFFLGEPDAEISAQQVEHRYQTQTLMQLRQQVEQLERQLARAKRKQRAQKSAMRKLKQKARERIAELKLLHREDSFKTVIEEWAPVAAMGAALYWFTRSSGSTERPESAPGDSPADSATGTSAEEIDILPATRRVHPLLESFVMLSDLVESRDVMPTDQELAQMPTRKLWSRIGTWLENATHRRPSRSGEHSSSSEWQAFHRVSDATSTLAFMSQSLQEGESAESLSGCSRTLLQKAEGFDEQLRSWIDQRNLTEPLSQADRTELLAFSADLASILRDCQPQRSDAFGQVLHDALNATRIRLLDAAGEDAEASKRAKKRAPLDLRSLVSTHGPQVLGRYVRQLFQKRAIVRDLLTRAPRPPAAESMDDDRRNESDSEPSSAAAASARPDPQTENEARSTVAPVATTTARIASTNSKRSRPVAERVQPEVRRAASAESNAQQTHPTLPPDELIRQLTAVLAEHPSWVETLTSELVAGGMTEISRGQSGPFSGIVESLDPTLRQELLDAVQAALQVPKADVGPN